MQQHDGERIDEAFGAAVANARTALGMSQRAFAKVLTENGLSIDASALSRMEQGKRAPRLSEALAISSALDLDLDDLIPEARSPRQHVLGLVRWADRKLIDLRLPLVEYMEAVSELHEYVAMNPDRLADLADESEKAPREVAHLFDWLETRISKGRQGEYDTLEFLRAEEFAWVTSEEAGDRILALIAHLSGTLINVAREDADGEPEA